MTHATVFLILDAARADYCRADTMPFLNGLARTSVTGAFESPPGFAQRTVLFSGRHPDTSGNFSAFVFDPEQSPFKWIRRTGPLRSLVRPRRILFPTRLGVQGLTRWFTGAYHTDPAWIPPKFLPFFRPCEDMRPIYEPGALGAPSVFDLLREQKRTFRYLAHPVSGDDEWIHNTLIKELRESRPYDLYVAQFSITDQKGHTDGPFSQRMQRTHLPLLDERVAMVHAALGAGYDTYDLFVCGDHGMGPVNRTVNVLQALKHVDARPAKDYVVFVNSTLAVFWYLTERGERAIEEALPRIPGARPVDHEERRRRRIPLDRRWGDRMLAADPGVLFWPDYFHVTDSTIVGMHGYLDKIEETHGLMVLASNRAAWAPNPVG
ncbi:MAG TPA: alkaline phosphatase family protein, partial [Candidatus Thermoplasmatota archaeon]|nr:alkaline phosphatase family protein [Candidatus Thermoplasmatota archaeon]